MTRRSRASRIVSSRPLWTFRTYQTSSGGGSSSSSIGRRGSAGSASGLGAASGSAAGSASGRVGRPRPGRRRGPTPRPRRGWTGRSSAGAGSSGRGRSGSSVGSLVGLGGLVGRDRLMRCQWGLRRGRRRASDRPRRAPVGRGRAGSAGLEPNAAAAVEPAGRRSTASRNDQSQSTREQEERQEQDRRPGPPWSPGIRSSRLVQETLFISASVAIRKSANGGYWTIRKIEPAQDQRRAAAGMP